LVLGLTESCHIKQKGRTAAVTCSPLEALLDRAASHANSRAIELLTLKENSIYDSYSKGKGKALPLQAWTGPEGSRRLRLPDFKTIGTLKW
jgi:hypothetical protein